MKQNLTFEEDDDNFLDKASYQKHIEEINHLTYMINSNMYLDKAQLYYQKGMNLSIIGNYSEAVQCFNKATNIDNNHAESYYQKGETLRTFLKDSKAAVIELDEAIRINPNYVEAYSTRGYALMDLYRYEDAAESFDKIIRINLEMGNKLPPISFEEAVRKQVMWHPLQLTRPNGYGEKALALKKLGKWEEVLECYNQLIKHQPGSEHHHHNRAEALLNLERIEEALESLNTALNIQPNNPFFLNTKGIALAKSGNRIATEEFFNKMLQSKSEFISSASTYLQKGFAMNILGDKKAALINFDFAIKASPDYYQAYKAKGLILNSLGDKKKALDCFNKATKINPDYADAYHCQGSILSELGEYWEAIKCYNKIIKITPNDAVAYNNKGWYLSKLGDHESALECINHSLEINPNSAHTHHSKGFALSALGMQKEAIESFNKALQLDFKLVEAHSDKGKSYLLLKNYPLAIECFDKALTINDNYSEAYNGKIQAETILSKTQNLLKNKWYGEVKGEISKFKNFQELKIQEEQYKGMFKYLQPNNFSYILEHMDDTESEILGNLDIEYQNYL
jgi:tetratricopeptide (TPR) repeat protein